MAADIFYEYNPDSYNEVIDEAPGSSWFASMRQVRWKPDGDYKFDVRKYFVKDGQEVTGKGISLSEEGAATLAETMVLYGYGSTDKIVTALHGREDFVDAIARETLSISGEFMASLEEAYYRIENEDKNKPVNAKEMLDSVL